MERLIRVLVIVALQMGSALAQPAATVSVDAGRDAPGSSLAALKRIFQSASAPEANGGLEPAWPIASALGMKAIRSINDADECSLDVARRIDRCGRLRGNLDWALRYRLTPHVVVGLRQPAFIKAPGATWGAEEWARYQDFAERLIRYIALFDVRGFSEIMIEVGNETDITGNPAELWTLADPKVPQGAERRYEHYLRVYRAWSAAVRAVSRELPEKRIRLAGPAMGGQGAFLNRGVIFHERFARAVAGEGLQLDLLSLHFYGDILRGWPGTPKSDLASLLARMRGALDSNGLQGTQIHITEWAADEAVDSRWNAGYRGAAWAVAFLTIAADAGVTGGSLWATRDVQGAARSGAIGIGSYTHVRDGHDHPKAYANAFMLLERLEGTRTHTETTDPGLRAIAAASDRSAGIAIANYGLDFASREDRSRPRMLGVSFRGLAFDGTATAERYAIDAEHGSLDRWQPINGTWPRTAGTLKKLESLVVEVKEGRLELPPRPAGESATVFWKVRHAR